MLTQNQQIAFFLCACLKLLFDIGPTIEELFDCLQIFYISDFIRKVKGWFQTAESCNKQQKWINDINEETILYEFWIQENIFIRELFIDRAIQGKLEQTAKPLYYGPENWKEKLRDAEDQSWKIQNEMYKKYIRRPRGPIARQHLISQSRDRQSLATNPTKHLSQPYQGWEARRRTWASSV
ncbi:hypothetical protein MGYG_07472 [Nannizzia gypsea CBS 118893]|uniref:Uncharacterized protein n=1 Tax=Arthroderma gypseum (strain ATCC MYA-4604 / CBS 118893) TaxID=535722 RepID=E4V390_ARTGP|nr:hypothetical protein MGYG_07472 [Nannizzia gypsea CBS 118893]EFR04464.1 hypothetical protein MGYG_07472 [Nannizzia gypsea CBS 118893]